MNFGEYILAFILALLILFIYTIFFNNLHDAEHMINISHVNVSKWNRNKCDYMMNETLLDELQTHGIEHSAYDWDVYFPCAYDEINKEIEEMPIVKNAKYFIIDNGDSMVAKEWLWKHIVSHYGIAKACNMMPNSYMLYDNIDRARFTKEYDTNKIYILKKNIQRQEGLKISNNKNEILDGYKTGYVVVQELLQDPYTIAGRKTNMRFYVLVVCGNGELNVFVHKDGFMYYTKEPFIKNSLATDPNITTGYIDRQIYIDNPLTHDDMRKYLDNPDRTELLEVEKYIKSQNLKISEVYFSRIYHLIREVFMAFVGKICISTKLSKNVSFQLFGVDIAVNDQLNPMIMEINKGPDLGAKDKKDSDLKHGVIKDTLAILKIIKYNSPKFIRVLDVSSTGTFQ
jgi:hypothetical protein